MPDDECTIELTRPILGSSETDEKSRKDRDREIDLLRRIAKELDKRHEESFRSKMFMLAFLLFILIFIVICTFVCLPCLFGLIVFSAITCPCKAEMNVPLWGSIIALIIRGWTFTNGHLTLTWS